MIEDLEAHVLKLQADIASVMLAKIDLEKRLTVTLKVMNSLIAALEESDPSILERLQAQMAKRNAADVAAIRATHGLQPVRGGRSTID